MQGRFSFVRRPFSQIVIPVFAGRRKTGTHERLIGQADPQRFNLVRLEPMGPGLRLRRNRDDSRWNVYRLTRTPRSTARPGSP